MARKVPAFPALRPPISIVGGVKRSETRHFLPCPTRNSLRTGNFSRFNRESENSFQAGHWDDAAEQMGVHVVFVKARGQFHGPRKPPKAAWSAGLRSAS